MEDFHFHFQKKFPFPNGNYNLTDMPTAVGTCPRDVMTFLIFHEVVDCLPAANGVWGAGTSRGSDWPADGVMEITHASHHNRVQL